MNQSSSNSLLWLLGAAALGAVTMFMLDPVEGRRRRALARDKALSARVKARKTIDARSRDLANRAHGLQTKVRHALPGRSDTGAARQPE